MSDSVPRPRLWAGFIIGAFMFIGGGILYGLSAFQSLEWLNLHFPSVYATIVSAGGASPVIIVLLILGTGLMLYTLRELLRIPPKQHLLKANAQKEASENYSQERQTQASNASIGDINVHVNQSNPQSQYNTQTVATTQAKPKLEPNIVRLPPRIWGLNVDSRTDVFVEAMRGEGDQAALAVYENTPLLERTIGGAYEVAALVIYSDKQGNEIHDMRIQDGCWLYANDAVSFPPRTKHQLILALKTHRGWVAIHGSPRDANPIPMTEGTFNVEVRLETKGQVIRVDRYIIINAKGLLSIGVSQ